mgnify:CR=1 FL=1
MDCIPITFTVENAMDLQPDSNDPIIPIIGLGTWKSKPGQVYTAVKEAITAGYRHIDCAPAYDNESEVGAAIGEMIKAGTITRENLWVTSKLWNNAHQPDQVLPALLKTLHDLRLDYLDLFLIHWPVAFKAEVSYPRSREDWLSLTEMPIIDTWQAMEACVGKGVVRHIGVSNFSIKKLDDLHRQATIPPAMNQVEMHPYLQQQAMLDYCRGQGTMVTAYSPLGSGDRPKALKSAGEPVLLQDPVLQGIADRHRCAVSQVLLAWAMARGVIVIPKSVEPKRIRQNLDAVKVELASEDMAAIAGLDRGHRYVDGSFWQTEGSPYTMAGIWDE